ncbi:MAG: hypothetical protein IKF79_02300 [Methanosphaera sp.]|nr:hypothetical protein [Methanosphaera sp.]
MPIEELQEPIWEKQKGETPNQHCYFLEFLEFPTFSLKDFHNHLCEKYSKVLGSTDKPKVPKYQTIKNWSFCNDWTSRKEAKRHFEKQSIIDELHELDKQDKIDNFKKKNSIRKKLLERLDNEAEFEKYSQLKHGVDAYVNMSDDNRIDMEEPTTFTNQKLDVDAETKVQYEGVENLLEVFHASKDEWDKRKSQ